MTSAASIGFLKFYLFTCLICGIASFLYDFPVTVVKGKVSAVPFATRAFQALFLQGDANVNAISTVNHKDKVARLVGYVPPDQLPELKRILLNAGYADVLTANSLVERSSEDNLPNKNQVAFHYKYVKASGMLKLVEDGRLPVGGNGAPKYIPVQSAEENVLVANGWSFLDPDESEPMSAFDIDAANLEGQYKPKWGRDDSLNSNDNKETIKLSSLGFHIGRLSSERVVSESRCLSQASREVLLNGGTDQPFQKITNNGYSFAGSISDMESGIFTCSVGGNILFTTHDLSPLTASSGWLTFSRPIANDHIELVYAEKDAVDPRVEVIDAKTGCHLGHYFGQDGYCINASALNFFPSTRPSDDDWKDDIHPVSWLKLSDNSHQQEPSKSSKSIVMMTLLQNVKSESILLGAGCFWHVEFALRRLPGIIDTKVGYAGGSFPFPTYDDVCNKETNHAEVVKVTFDPSVLDPRLLLDCFFAMHDPTMVKAHGERAQYSGQYRSCIFVFSNYMEDVAKSALEECRKQLRKMISTEVAVLPMDAFWEAEARRQRHDERVMRKATVDDVETLMDVDWLRTYGRRASSIWGTSETMTVMLDDSDDDGMAQMMI
jgi:methionine-S-sulfoxide reductase